MTRCLVFCEIVIKQAGLRPFMKTHAFRLTPGQDLREELERFVKEKNIRAGIVLTCVGSLRKAALRVGNSDEKSALDGIFEILSLSGTLSKDGIHCHIGLSDVDGRFEGGHLKKGCIIHTTAEMVVGELGKRCLSLGKWMKEQDIENSTSILKKNKFKYLIAPTPRINPRGDFHGQEKKKAAKKK